MQDYERDQKARLAQEDEPYNPQSNYRKSIYTQDMIDKYLARRPVWMFWETCALGSLIDCYRFFGLSKFPGCHVFAVVWRTSTQRFPPHNCLLIPPTALGKQTNDLDDLLELLLHGDTNLVGDTLRLAKTDPLIHDFSCVLLSYMNLVGSEGMREDVTAKMHEFTQHMRLHADWYENSENGCELLVQRMNAIQLLIDCTIDFEEERKAGTLSDDRKRILQQPHRRSVRHEPRRMKPHTDKQKR